MIILWKYLASFKFKYCQFYISPYKNILFIKCDAMIIFIFFNELPTFPCTHTSLSLGLTLNYTKLDPLSLSHDPHLLYTCPTLDQLSLSQNWPTFAFLAYFHFLIPTFTNLCYFHFLKCLAYFHFLIHGLLSFSPTCQQIYFAIFLLYLFWLLSVLNVLLL